MGVIGERLKEKGWSKSRVEWLGVGLTLVFWATLIYFAWASGTLEGECKAVLPTGAVVSFDPREPPEFLDLVVFVNISPDTDCTYKTYCHEVLECDWQYDEKACWSGVCI